MAVTFGCVLSPTIYGSTASPEALRTLTQQAEAVGFDAVWFADHIIILRHVQSFYPYAADGASPLGVSLYIKASLTADSLAVVFISEKRCVCIPYSHRIYTELRV